MLSEPTNLKFSCDTLEASIGLHLIIDYHNCKLDKLCEDLSNLSYIISSVREKLDSSGISVLGVNSHFFAANAISVSFHLSESHLHFHTWPEKEYVSFDFFCCSQIRDLEVIMLEIADFCELKYFKSNKSNKKLLNRG